jgi:hypothetical protein
MLFGRSLFWYDKCDCAFIEGVVVRILQFKKYFVRTGEQTLQEDWVTTRICSPYGERVKPLSIADA